MAIDDKVIAAPIPKDDASQPAEVACSAEFSAQGCMDAAPDADEK